MTVFESSEALLRHMREMTDTVALSFSRGKDSLCAWLVLAPYFKVRPVYYSMLPELLSFESDSLHYYENVFRAEITVFWNPLIKDLFLRWGLQPEHRRGYLDSLQWRVGNKDAETRRVLNDESIYIAQGVTRYDNLNRAVAMKRTGSLNQQRKVFYPIFDYTRTRIIETIKQHDVKLPYDYRMFGRSFDGLDYQYISAIKREFPADYEIIRFWFPMIESEIKRFEYYRLAGVSDN